MTSQARLWCCFVFASVHLPETHSLELLAPLTLPSSLELQFK